MDLYLKRLTLDDPASWEYWPVLEARVAEQVKALEPDATPEMVTTFLRTLWVTQPARIRAWLALPNTWPTPRPRLGLGSDMPRPVAHMVAYVDLFWGEPCVMVYQLAGDPHAGALDLLVPMMREFEVWRHDPETRKQAGGKVLDLVRFYTNHPAGFIRWFRPVVELQRGGTYLSFRLSHVAVPSEAV